MTKWVRSNVANATGAWLPSRARRSIARAAQPSGLGSRTTSFEPEIETQAAPFEQVVVSSRRDGEAMLRDYLRIASMWKLALIRPDGTVLFGRELHAGGLRGE